MHIKLHLCRIRKVMQIKMVLDLKEQCCNIVCYFYMQLLEYRKDAFGFVSSLLCSIQQFCVNVNYILKKKKMMSIYEFMKKCYRDKIN